MERSGVLDMFVLYIDDSVVDGTCRDEIKQSNILVLLTCTTYLIYDGRSMEERSKVPVEFIVSNIEAEAIKKCLDCAAALARTNQMGKLITLRDNLANVTCRKQIEKLMQPIQKKKEDAPISI